MLFQSVSIVVHCCRCNIWGFFVCLFSVSQSLEPSHQILSENIALAIILPIILVILLIGGIYMYYSK